jgi:hypothetical protein
MDRIYLFLIRNDVWIYIVSVVGLIWYLIELIRAQRLLRRAMFNIERETATRIRNNALSFVLFFAAVIGVVYYVNARVAPALPQELLVPATPTPNTFATPLSRPTPQGDGNPESPNAGSPALAPTVTLPAELGGAPPPEPELTEGTPVPEQAPQEAPTSFTACLPQLRFTEPLEGSVAFAGVVFRGTADTGETHQYVIELNGPQTAGGWEPLTVSPLVQPVIDGELGTADLSLWADGPYLARLRATDQLGNEIGVCVTQFTLDNR